MLMLYFLLLLEFSKCRIRNLLGNAIFGTSPNNDKIDVPVFAQFFENLGGTTSFESGDRYDQLLGNQLMVLHAHLDGSQNPEGLTVQVSQHSNIKLSHPETFLQREGEGRE